MKKRHIDYGDQIIRGLNIHSERDIVIRSDGSHQAPHPTISLEELADARVYVSPKPLPEVEEQYYVVGGKRFELDNRKGAEWYAGKYAARKGQKPRFDRVTVYNRTYDRQDF